MPQLICLYYKTLSWWELKLILCMHLCLQAIKESATELLFGGHETTASTATSLVMFLGLNPEVVDKMRLELMDKVIHNIPLLR